MVLLEVLLLGTKEYSEGPWLTRAYAGTWEAGGGFFSPFAGREEGWAEGAKLLLLQQWNH